VRDRMALFALVVVACVQQAIDFIQSFSELLACSDRTKLLLAAVAWHAARLSNATRRTVV